MRLFELLKGIKTIKSKVSFDIEIENVFSDSRKVKANGLFVSLKGEKRDGNEYIEQVLEGGASCVITDSNAFFEKYKRCVLVKNAREALAFIWSNYYGNPTDNMKVIGITGTNGKTSCAYFLYNILRCSGKKSGLISTVECLINNDKYDTNGGSDVSDLYSAMTTPDPEILYRIFFEMHRAGVEYAVMEASSHAIELSKLAPIKLKVGIFTNLSAEHLDFHKNMENYFASKRKLFDRCELGIINVDDEYGKRLFYGQQCKMISVSVKDKADIYASECRFYENGSNYLVNMESDRLNIECKICGEYSVYNSILAVACALKLKIEGSIIQNGASKTENIPGRLERIGNSNIFIDYAHTPYAMEKVLSSVKRAMPQNRIVALFGCGGDRDKGKRPMMGKIASEMADKAIITSDNPRGEEPLRIIIDILGGVSENSDIVVIPNRKKAIEYAISIKKDTDALILLGKGHEEYEIDKNGKHYFSEKAIIKEFFNDDKNKASLDI